MEELTIVVALLHDYAPSAAMFIIKTPAEDVACASLADARRAIAEYVSRAADASALGEVTVCVAKGRSTTAVDLLAPLGQ